MNNTTVYNNRIRHGQYIQGNTVRKIDVVEEINKPIKTVDYKVLRNREKAKKMSFTYVLFLSVAVAFAGMMLIGYIKMQSELTVSVKRVAALESQLNNMKLTNDEELERIESSVNLEEIKKIAVEELGMTYAKSGQVVTITDEGSDYVRQIEELP